MSARARCTAIFTYMVNTAAGGALIEQTIFIGANARSVLAHEVADLTDDLYRSLLTSIDSRARRPSDF